MGLPTSYAHGLSGNEGCALVEGRNESVDEQTIAVLFGCAIDLVDSTVCLLVYMTTVPQVSLLSQLQLSIPATLYVLYDWHPVLIKAIVVASP